MLSCGIQADALAHCLGMHCSCSCWASSSLQFEYNIKTLSPISYPEQDTTHPRHQSVHRWKRYNAAAHCLHNNFAGVADRNSWIAALAVATCARTTERHLLRAYNHLVAASAVVAGIGQHTHILHTALTRQLDGM